MRRRVAAAALVGAILLIGAITLLLQVANPAMRVIVATGQGAASGPVVRSGALACVYYAAIYVGSAADSWGALWPSRSSYPPYLGGDGFHRIEADPKEVYDDMSGHRCSSEVTLSVRDLPAGPPPYVVIVEARDGYATYSYAVRHVEPAELDAADTALRFSLADFSWPARKPGSLEGQPCTPGQPLPPGYVCQVD